MIRKPMSEARVAIVTTSALLQCPFTLSADGLTHTRNRIELIPLSFNICKQFVATPLSLLKI